MKTLEEYINDRCWVH